MPGYEPNYVVGRGRTYFDQFRAGSNQSLGGEMYFGNTPELTLNTDSETLDHYSSESGLRNLDMTILLEMTRGGTFTCDEINANNLALFFLGEKAVTANVALPGQKHRAAAIAKGRYIQLGESDANPTGVRDINNLKIVVAPASATLDIGSGDISTIVGATELPLLNNVEADLAMGRVYIEIDAPDVTGEMQAVFQYDVAAQSRTSIIGRSNMIYGALRFISDNPVGNQKDYFFPKVALQPDGDYALKGDDWQVMSFTFRTLQKSSNRAHVYIDVRDSTVTISEADQRFLSVTPASTTGTVNTPVNVVVTVRDGFNNIVPNVELALSVGAGATVTPTSATTNTSGQATVQVNRTTAGLAVLTATIKDTTTSATGATITFSV